MLPEAGGNAAAVWYPTKKHVYTAAKHLLDKLGLQMWETSKPASGEEFKEAGRPRTGPTGGLYLPLPRPYRSVETDPLLSSPGRAMPMAVCFRRLRWTAAVTTVIASIASLFLYITLRFVIGYIRKSGIIVL
jgi:hypothetical protein